MCASKIAYYSNNKNNYFDNITTLYIYIYNYYEFQSCFCLTRLDNKYECANTIMFGSNTMSHIESVEVQRGIDKRCGSTN